MRQHTDTNHGTDVLNQNAIFNYLFSLTERCTAGFWIEIRSVIGTLFLCCFAVDDQHAIQISINLIEGLFYGELRKEEKEIVDWKWDKEMMLDKV